MSIADEFHEAMINIYHEAGNTVGYWANYFYRSVNNDGGLVAAKRLLDKKQGTTNPKGFQKLIDHGLVNLSVEATVLKPQFHHLFTPQQLKTAQARLDAVPVHGFGRSVPADEIQIEDLDETEVLPEGATRKIVINAYERNAKARKKCLEHHGYACKVCDMRFSKVYGKIGEGFIHVHHTKPLSNIKGSYKVNPIKDLVPVCPNCHAMLHSRKPPLTVRDLREIYATNNTS